VSNLLALFLSLEDVVVLHSKSLKRYGGSEGIRDQGLLESAVDQARNVFYYAKGDLFEIAATYAFHIAQAQAFFDGNKRTAVAAMLCFLDLNGIDRTFDSDALYEAMIAIAEKRFSRSDLANLLRGQP
jgi:death-on-curing protein